MNNIVVLFVVICFAGNAFGALSSTTLCTGNPPKFNGLPCASTTRYWDGQMGACGYVNNIPLPISLNSHLHSFT